MKPQRWAAAAAAAAAFFGLTLTAGATPAAAQEAAPAYVALGDSYSSGVGAGDYDPDSGDCKRSANAYPQLWSAANAPSSFDFVACSGATTDDVLSGQLDALSDATGVVSISIGGNDVGFADTMTTCALNGEAACLERVAEARAYVTDTLPARLDGVYDAIKAKAPSAKVVVLGYPRFYQLEGSCDAGLSEASRAAINSAADDLSTVTQDRATSHGFSYGDLRPAFTGHEICSSDWWLHSVSVPDVGQSYHPTEEGQSGGYYTVMEGLV
ncbi:SGNH/GDSL hydrolase family protein [Streptomyces sp. NPDC054796]